MSQVLDLSNKADLLDARANELTAVINRDIFDIPPGDVTSPDDIARWKRFREDYHNAARNLQDFPFPLQLDFELNSMCNFRCSFCVHGYTKVPKKILPFETFKRVIDEAADYGLCSIKMNYINEPLLQKDIPEFIKYAKSKGVLNIYFASNGLLLNEEMGRRLIDAGLSKIMISLDAITPETFKIMRNSTRYEKVVENIHNFLDLRERMGVSWPMVRVNFLKTKLNAHEAEAFIDLWADVADAIGFQNQVGLPGIDDDLLPDNGVSIDLGMLHNKKKEFKCSFPFKLMVVDCDGNILPCCTFSGRELAMSNINDTTIKEAWESAKMRELKDLHRRGGYLENPVCAHCVRSSGAEV